MNGIFTFLAEVAKLKKLGWGYYNSGKEGSLATHETVRNKVVKLKTPKDVSDYTTARSTFKTVVKSKDKNSLIQKLANAKKDWQAAKTHFISLPKHNPSFDSRYTGSGEFLNQFLKTKNLQFHTAPGSVGYAGPKGSKTITHFHDGVQMHTLTKGVSKKLSAHFDQIQKQKEWTKHGTHHPVTSYAKLYNKARHDMFKKEDQVVDLKRQMSSKNIGISHALQHYTKTAKGMSEVHPSLKKSVKNYTGEDYEDINDKLVNPKIKHTYLSPQKIDQHVQHIDKAIKANPAKGHLTVYRGVSDHLIKKMGLHNSKTTHFASPAYMSTSLSPDTATNFGSHLLITRVPKGHPALYAEPHSHHKGEKEVLIPRGATHKVIKVSKRPNGKYRIETELQHPSSIKGK